MATRHPCGCTRFSGHLLAMAAGELLQQASVLKVAPGVGVAAVSLVLGVTTFALVLARFR